MKTVVSVNEISEFEIKPKDVLDKWKIMVAEEISSRWPGSKEWNTVSCPVCKNSASSPAFSKQGFAYVECNDCKTLYAQTRPSSKELSWWYKESQSVRSWQENLLKQSALSRSEKIIEPRANWILDGLSEYIPNLQLKNTSCTDISFFGNALLQKISEYAGEMQLTAAGITASNENYTAKNIQAAPITSIDDLSGLQPADVLVAIDVLERITSIHDFFAQLETVVKPGGLVFATCPVSSGFEIQSLWERSSTITQPDKLNLPSVNGLIKCISAASQWEIMELSTPGMFDVELVKRAMQQSNGENWPRSLHTLLDNIDASGVERLTEYLQSQRLSSFARIVLRRNKI
jgi:hypothetical protein